MHLPDGIEHPETTRCGSGRLNVETSGLKLLHLRAAGVSKENQEAERSAGGSEVNMDLTGRRVKCIIAKNVEGFSHLAASAGLA
jgi:hypothetical protein